MRTSFFAVASLAVLSALSLNAPAAQAKSLSNRHQNHDMLAVRNLHVEARSNVEPRAKECRAVKKKKKSKKHRKTTTTKKASATFQQAAKATVSTKKTTTSSRKSTTTSKSSTRSSSTTSSTRSSSSASRTTTSSSSASSSSSTASNTNVASFAGAAPPNSPWGNCFQLTATAFQPNWKGEATTTWCGVEFDKSSPIIALPLQQLSKAYGSDKLVTYYSNETLWRQMVKDWCGRELWINGPGGMFKAYFGDANLWTSVVSAHALVTEWLVNGILTGCGLFSLKCRTST